jgi:CrcB protein
MERHFLSQNLTIGLTVGLLGGFTTFSSYCLEFVRLLEESNLFSGFLYLSLSPFLGTLATYLGMLLARR